MVRPSVSVLMATYHAETASNLEAALESVFQQTLPAKECILVVDGPIDAEQKAVIERFEKRNGSTTLVVEWLPEQRGQAGAWNAGLPRCTGELIARMDSDDICVPQRFELQTRTFADAPDLDLVCAWSAEFESDPKRTIYIKETPEHHDDIVRMLKRRWCITHPTVMVRRNILERVGGYRSCFGTLADNDLYARLLLAGARFYSIQQPLVSFRISDAQRARRGGLAIALDELRLRWFCWKLGFLTPLEFVRTVPGLVAFRLLPTSIRGYAYRFARTRPESA